MKIKDEVIQWKEATKEKEGETQKLTQCMKDMAELKNQNQQLLQCMKDMAEKYESNMAELKKQLRKTRKSKNSTLLRKRSAMDSKPSNKNAFEFHQVNETSRQSGTAENEAALEEKS